MSADTLVCSKSGEGEYVCEVCPSDLFIAVQGTHSRNQAKFVWVQTRNKRGHWRTFLMKFCLSLYSCEHLMTVLTGNVFLASYQVLYYIEDMISYHVTCLDLEQEKN